MLEDRARALCGGGVHERVEVRDALTSGLAGVAVAREALADLHVVPCLVGYDAGFAAQVGDNALADDLGADKS